MRFENVSILGLAAVDAPHRVTSAEIGQRLGPTMARLGLHPGVIEALTGITARRWWDPEVPYHRMASWAGEKVIEESHLDRSKLGVLVSASVCKDYIEPSMASLVHGSLKLPSTCLNFDIGNACLAFVNAMEVVGNLIERGQVDYGIIVDGEGSRYTQERTIERLLRPETSIVDFRDNFATLTLGSGAGAMILARSDLAPGRPRVLGGVALAATAHNRLCLGQPDRMTTDAANLLTAGLELAGATWDLARREFQWTSELLGQCVIHQVSGVHTAKFRELCGIPDHKVHRTYPEYGNIGPANIPITLAKAVEAGKVRKGDRVALMGIGSGLNCSMMDVAW
ncbi:MAG: 3-oxoacyl-ACP synthase III [Pseudomonadota bacterium]